jgi:hypothetical protein
MTENGTFFQEICRFFALLYDLLSIYNMPFSRPLQSIQKNRNGSVRQYPVNASSATISMAAERIAIANPKCS